MMKIVERWLLFTYIHGAFTLIETVQDKSTSGEGAIEATGAGTAVGCGGRDSN
jgi:hypothetical protein